MELIKHARIITNRARENSDNGDCTPTGRNKDVRELDMSDLAATNSKDFEKEREIF